MVLGWRRCVHGCERADGCACVREIGRICMYERECVTCIMIG